MVDRTDIDALLIGALYGELTPADEARLTAHLESHPADRTALADLTATRAAVRESRLFALQLDPPPAVSALLVREAARRAPRVENEGWFQRFVRAFTAHPAMAAAAMLVIVVGVAGTAYLRNGDQFAAPKAESVAQSERMTNSAATPVLDPAAQPAAAPLAAPPPAAAPAVASAPTAATTTADTMTAAGSGYAVDLAAEKAHLYAEGAAKKDAVAAKSSRGRNEVTGGIELRKAEPQPRDLDESKLGFAKEQRAAPKGGKAAPAAADDADGSDDRFAGAAAPGPTKPMAKAPARTVSPDPEAQAQVAQAAPPPAPAAELAEPRADKALDANAEWARKQHAQVVALVAANRCEDAAAAALAIYNRAPDYYNGFVASDRNIKPCVQYVTHMREKEDRARAAKRANAVEAAPKK